MKKLLLAALMMLTSGWAWANTSVVEGKIAKVVPAKTEIYVMDNTNAKKHEYYFTKETKILKAGQPVEFSQLKEGLPVRVTAKVVGKRLDPQQVEILE